MKDAQPRRLSNLVSRSQNPPRSVEVAQVKLAADATEAQVNTRWEYGSGQKQFDYTITFMVRKHAGGWLVDDTYCLNDPASSIYNQPAGPCPIASSTNSGEAPGMPRTGEGAAPGYAVLLLLGLVVSSLGLLLARKGAPAAR